MSDVNINIKVITNEAQKALNQFKRAIEGIEKPLKDNETQSKSFFKRFRDELLKTDNIARGVFVGGFGANLAARAVGEAVRFISQQLVSVVDEYRKYEVALVGVQKTTGFTREEVEKLGRQFQGVSETIPVATNELLRLAQVAAQLGVRGERALSKFAETAARLSDTVEGISGENAAIELARIIKLTGESNDNIDRLASTLVGLGNNFAVVEGEVVFAANEIARAGAAFGLTANEAIAFAVAFKEAGVQSELTGSTVSRVFNQIASAAAEGGSQFDTFAQIIGTTTDQLQKDIQIRGGQVLKDFFKGLAEVQSKRGIVGVKQALDQLSLSSIRNDKTLLPLINNQKNLENILSSSIPLYNQNNAAIEESNRKYDTLDGSIIRFNNSIKNLKANIGALTGGPLRDMIDGFRIMTSAISNFVKSTNETELDKLNNELDIVSAKISDLRRFLKLGNNQDRTLFGFVIKSAKEAQIELTALEADASRILKIKAELEAKEEQQASQTSGGQSPRVAAAKEEAATLVDIQRNFSELISQVQEDTEIAQLEAQVLFIDQRFQNIADALGREEALILAKKANELSQEKKFEEAKQLIKQAAAKADEKRLKEEEKLEKERVENRKSTLNTISSLQSSSNRELAAIGKAAALTQIAIDGPVAVTKALSAFPPPFNYVAAAAVGAAVAAQAARVTGVAFEDGGIVPGNSFSGDKVQARVNSGEMILNRQQQSELFALANGSRNQSSQEQVFTAVVELDGEEIARSVSRRVADGIVLGENL